MVNLFCSPHCSSSVHSYSFVWTSDDSKFRFGFCRHDPKTRSAMVLITYLPWHDTFLKLLAVLSELRRNQNGEFQAFLSEAYNKGVPERGSSLKLFYNSGQNVRLAPQCASARSNRSQCLFSTSHFNAPRSSNFPVFRKM